MGPFLRVPRHKSRFTPNQTKRPPVKNPPNRNPTPSIQKPNSQKYRSHPVAPSTRRKKRVLTPRGRAPLKKVGPSPRRAPAALRAWPRASARARARRPSTPDQYYTLVGLSRPRRWGSQSRGGRARSRHAPTPSAAGLAPAPRPAAPSWRRAATRADQQPPHAVLEARARASTADISPQRQSTETETDRASEGARPKARPCHVTPARSLQSAFLPWACCRVCLCGGARGECSPRAAPGP